MDRAVLRFEPEAAEAFRRTRPWMYVLAVTTVIVCIFMAVLLIAGFAGLGANPVRAHPMITFAGFALIGSIPTAVVQMGYAMALTDVTEAEEDSLPGAMERACVRQRNLWIITAIAVGLAGLGTIMQLLKIVF